MQNIHVNGLKRIFYHIVKTQKNKSRGKREIDGKKNMHKHNSLNSMQI